MQIKCMICIPVLLELKVLKNIHQYTLNILVTCCSFGVICKIKIGLNPFFTGIPFSSHS